MNLSKLSVALVIFFLCNAGGCSKSKKNVLPFEKGGTYLKWVIKKSPDQITSLELKKVDLPFRKTLFTVGNYAVIASAKGKNVAALPFEFSATIHSETRDAEGHRHSSRSAVEGDLVTEVWIPMEQPFDTVSVMDPAGKIVLTEKNFTAAQKIKPGLFGCQLTAERPAFFGHIQTVLPEDMGSLAPAMQRRITDIINPDTLFSKEAVLNEFRQMAEGPLSAVSHIAFVHYTQDYQNVIADTYGSIMLVNVNALGGRDFPGTIIHEAAHAYENLLNSFAMGEQLQMLVTQTAGNWPQDVRSLAQETLHRLGFRMSQSFGSLWQSIHQMALQYSLTFNYTGDQWQGVSSEQATRNGFASPYGTTNWSEDIATFTERIQGADLVGEAPVCDQLRNAGSRFPIQLALPYIKILMLKNAGFLSPEKVERCTGAVVIHGEEGIHLLGVNREPVLSFTSGLKTGFEQNHGHRYFDVIGSGPNSYQILIQVNVGDHLFPVGLYRLDSINLITVNWQGNDGVYLAHRDNFKARGSASGLVLISDYTPSKVEGAIFFLALQNAGGMVTDTFPLATFRKGR